MEDRGSITWKQFQRQVGNGVADDTNHKYKLGLRGSNTPATKHGRSPKKIEKTIEESNDYILGSDTTSKVLIKTLLECKNVCISIKRYNELIKKYKDVEGIIVALLDNYKIKCRIRYVSPDSYIDDNEKSGLDGACLMMSKPKNDSGFYVIEEV